MSLEDFAPTTVTLQQPGPTLAGFGLSVLHEALNSQQFSKFDTLTGGSSTMEIGRETVVEQLESIGLFSGSDTFESVTAHFRSPSAPSKCFLTYRGVADQAHIQTLTVNPAAGTTDRAEVGLYRLTDIEGGPYSYNSPGTQQVVTLTVTDIGGGFGAFGLYRVQDVDNNIYTYESGGVNVWTITIDSAATGTYNLVVDGVTYAYTAGPGDTVTSIRDGLFANIISATAHPPHPTWISNSVGIDEITVTGSSIGLQLVVTSNDGPGGTESTLVETVALVPETVAAVATALSAAITGAAAVPSKWDPVSAAAVITITAKITFTGVDLEIAANGPSAGDVVQLVTVDHRESVTAVRDALDTAIGLGVHPSFTAITSGPASETITGLTAGSAVTVAVSSPNSLMSLTEAQSVFTFTTTETRRFVVVPLSGSSAHEGTYVLTLFGESLNYVVAVASGDTITTVRDALKTKIIAEVPEVSVADVGVDALNITTVVGGLGFSISQSSPNSNLALALSLVSEAQGAANDFDRARDDEDDWYFWLSHDNAIGCEAVAIHLDLIASSNVFRFQWYQSRDSAIINDAEAISTDIAQIINNQGTSRTKVAWNPVPSSVTPGTSPYEGLVNMLVGGYATSLPGKANPHAFRMDNQSGDTVTGGQKLTAVQNINRSAKRAGFFESIKNLGTALFNGPYLANGRQIDVTRGRDQIHNVYQVGALALLANRGILPQTTEGISLSVAMITDVTNNLVAQGLVLQNSFVWLTDTGTPPKISDLSEEERIAGFLPPFPFRITIQVGVTEITQDITVAQ